MTDTFENAMNPPEEDTKRMIWHKVNLRTKDKNLPSVNERVVWATTEGSFNGKTYHKFFGWLTDNGKIDSGLGLYKLTSNYYWMNLEDPN